MTEKLSECCELCMGNGWVLDMRQEQYQCPKCKGSGKPCTIASKPEKEDGYWFCPECKEEKLWHHVTYHELCSDCGAKVIWKEIKPAASPDRLLTKEETENHLYQISTAPEGYEFTGADGTLTKASYVNIKPLLQAQDAKTYFLAFEAGRKAQAEKDRGEIAAIKAMWQEDIEKLKTQLDTANNCLNFANDSNLKGREEMYQLQATHKAELERVKSNILFVIRNGTILNDNKLLLIEEYLASVEGK